MSKLVDIQFVSGVEGPHLEVSNKGGGYRLAGPKAWGGGTVIHSFTVSLDELIKHATAEAYEPVQPTQEPTDG